MFVRPMHVVHELSLEPSRNTCCSRLFSWWKQPKLYFKISQQAIDYYAANYNINDYKAYVTSHFAYEEDGQLILLSDQSLGGERLENAKYYPQKENPSEWSDTRIRFSANAIYQLSNKLLDKLNVYPNCIVALKEIQKSRTQYNDIHFVTAARDGSQATSFLCKCGDKFSLLYRGEINQVITLIPASQCPENTSRIKFLQLRIDELVKETAVLQSQLKQLQPQTDQQSSAANTSLRLC